MESLFGSKGSFIKRTLKQVVSTTIAIIFATLLVPSGVVLTQGAEQAQASELVSVIDIEQTVKALENRALPIGDIVIEKDEDDWGVVLYIPQYHRYPGSDVADTRNNPGQRAQEDIYLILQEVFTDVPVKLAFVEGEFAGVVNDEKRASLRERMDALSAFESEVAKVPEIFAGDMTEEELKELMTRADETIVFMRRALILEGAPENLWAEGADIQLLGTENEQTKAESAELVRNHVYLQDRLNAVSQQPRVTQTGLLGSFKLSNPQELMQLPVGERKAFMKQALLKMILEKFQGNAQVSEMLLAKLGGLTSNKSSVADYLEKLEGFEATFYEKQAEDEAIFMDGFVEQWKKLIAVPKAETADVKTPLPSREDNPFSHIQDRQQLQLLMNQNEAKMKEIVVERRNHETAENVSRQMKELNENISLLQYGAGHTEGLVEELRKQNLSVITIVPKTVHDEDR